MTALTKERRRTIGWAFVGVCAGIVVVLLITVVVNTSKTVTTIRATQKTNTAVNSTNSQLLEIIHSCLTPGQPCYQQGIQQRAATAQDTKHLVIAVVTCAFTLPQVNATTVNGCVDDQLASAS